MSGNYKLGGIAKYGTRCIIKETGAPLPEVICTVEMPSAGYRRVKTFTERRAERDAKAQLIVDALNAFSTHKVNEDV